MYLEQSNPTHRSTKYKKRKKKPLILIILFFLLISIMLFLNSDISRIKSIEINGNNLLSENDIQKQADIYLDINYFFIKTSSIEAKLLNLDEVKEVKAEKQFPGQLKVDIVEFKPVAIWLKGDKTLPILENGYVYSGKNKIYVDYPIVSKWGDEKLIPELANELSQVDSSILQHISEIQLNPQAAYPKQLLLITREGYKIHICLDDISEKLDIYPDILASLEDKETKLGEIYLLESMRFEEYVQEQEPKR